MNNNSKSLIDDVNTILDTINAPKNKEVVDLIVKRHPEPPPDEVGGKEEWQEKLRKGWTEFFDDKHQRNDQIKAFEIISDSLSRQLSKIEFNEIQNEWKEAVKNLGKNIKATKSDNQSNPLFEKPLSEMCGISEKTLGHFYEVGIGLYNDKKFNEAELVFRLITFLNSLKENVWISLGLCQKQLSNPVFAIFSFGMAIIMNPDNALSYIHSAECYLELNERDEAKECLLSAQEMLKQQNIEHSAALIDFVRNLLKRC